MERTIISEEEIIDGEEVNVWYLMEGEEEIANINETLGESVTECDWYVDQKFLIVNYSDWDSTELVAILDKHGDILRAGIKYIEDHNDEHDFFIINITGVGLGEQSAYYQVDDYDYKMCVIDSSEGFIIEPEFDYIQFDEDESIFIAKKGEHETKFDLRGIRIK